MTGHSQPTEPSTSGGQGALFGSQDFKREADLRQQAVERLRYLSIQHAMHAWERRYRDPIAPYAFAFLYAQPAPQQSWQSLNAATKLWLAGPEASDLPRLLFDLNNLVAQHTSDPEFDIRRNLANRVDDKMADDAWYIGLAVSSLDTYSGAWDRACKSVDSHADLPATIRIVMIDSTMIACDRRGHSEFNTMAIRSTHPLSMSMLDSPHSWTGITPSELRNDAQHAGVLRWMEELNLSLWRTDNARLAARRERQT